MRAKCCPLVGYHGITLVFQGCNGVVTHVKKFLEKVEVVMQECRREKVDSGREEEVRFERCWLEIF